MAALDEAIRQLHNSTGWGARQVASSLGENIGTCYKRMVRMGLTGDLGSNQYGNTSLAQAVLPFTLDRTAAGSKEERSMKGSQAMGEAIAWFLAHGYTPSLPFLPAKYDLVVDSDRGLQRVQIKYTSQRNRTGGSYVASTRYREHRSGQSKGSKAYTTHDVDLFFIVTADHDYYIIPIEATAEKTSICLDRAYLDYKVT